MSLYKKYRPARLDQVVGQDTLKGQLRQWVGTGTTPHFLLFTGPSGCGKTTLARILANGLKVQGLDYQEMNCAADNGVDMVRDLRSRQGLAPTQSPVRMVVIDECHQLTKQAQEALLKMLEDTPKHVHYVFCTTDPSKLLPTIKTRATQVQVNLLTNTEAAGLLARVCAAEGKTITEDESDKIVELAAGSARKLLVLLEQLLVAPEPRLNALGDAVAEVAAFAIAKALQAGRAGWATLAPMIKDVQEDPEAVRRICAGYFTTVLLGATQKPERPAALLDIFLQPWYDTPKAQMVAAIYKASQL